MTASAPAAINLARRVRRFASPNRTRSAWQLLSTLALYALGWTAMVLALEVHYAVTLLLAIPVAGLTLRIWVLQHDMGHAALFRGFWNDVAGCVCGVLTLLPFYHWRRVHNLHHAHSGNLDRRGPGYITTLTVTEYRNLRWWRRALYRLYRHPAVILVPGAWYYFLFQHRVPYAARRSWVRERWSVYLTNLAVGALAVVIASRIGWAALLMVHIPVILLTSTVGAWIFLVQHSFEDSYWAPQREWDYVRAAIDGSSYYRMPRLMAWFTADVGYHHVHHLSPRIPNYRLAECHRETPELRAVEPMTTRALLRTARMALWDEARQRMVSFADARTAS